MAGIRSAGFWSQTRQRSISKPAPINMKRILGDAYLKRHRSTGNQNTGMKRLKRRLKGMNLRT